MQLKGCDATLKDILDLPVIVSPLLISCSTVMMILCMSQLKLGVIRVDSVHLSELDWHN